jgi:heptosyltransferase-3
MSGSIRTLVVHTGGIGDFLMCCPTLIRLAEEGPVELLGRPERLRLAVAGGIATAAHDIDRVGFESVFGNPNMRLRRFLSPIDRVIVWMKDAGEIERGIRRCGISDIRAFQGIPPDDWKAHASEYYMECLGFPDAPPLRLPIAAHKIIKDVIIHPGSGSRKKNWPFELFRSLGQVLEEQGRSVWWCIGPAEDDSRIPDNGHMFQTGSLETLAHYLSAAHLYIGNDSGISHLAAAVGCRTIAIFGPTDPRVWAPLGSNVIIVKGQPWPDVSTVLRASEVES